MARSRCEKCDGETSKDTGGKIKMGIASFDE